MAYDYSRQAAENAARQAAQQHQQMADMQRQAAAVRERAEAAYRQELIRQEQRRIEQSRKDAQSAGGKNGSR